MPKPPPLTLQTRADLTTPTDAIKEARRLPLDRIDSNPTQSRQSFDEAALAELAASIAAQGVIQPIVVRPAADRYQVVAGERRTRAARLAGLTEIPAIIRDLTDEQAAYVTAVENLQRADLDIEDEARQYQALMALTGLSGRQLADQLGKAKDYVNRRLSLLQRPYLFAKIRNGEITITQALAHIAALAQLPDNSITYDAGDVVARDAPLREGDSISMATERAELDTRPGPIAPPPAISPTPPVYQPPTPYLGAAPDAASLQRTPWRARPLLGFMDWAARVDATTVPPTEKAQAREYIQQAREWLERLEQQLTEGEPEE